MIVLDLTLRVEIRREILINRRVLAVRAPPEREEPGRGWEIGRSRRAASGRANPPRPVLQLPSSLEFGGPDCHVAILTRSWYVSV